MIWTLLLARSLSVSLFLYLSLFTTSLYVSVVLLRNATYPS